MPHPFHAIRPTMQRVAAVVAAVLAAGAAGYSLIEGWPLFDSLYMTVITLATVGYGETHPLSTAGRVFTIVLILSGIGVLTWAFSTVTAFVVEGELRGALRRHRMEQQIAALKDHYIVCGASRIGLVIIEELAQTRRSFVVIDRTPAVCERLGSRGLLALQGDALENGVLLAAGIQRARGLLATLPSDRDNAFVILAARGLNTDMRIVTQQADPHVREILLRSGASAVVNPNAVGGLRMASEMLRPGVVAFLDDMLRGKETVSRFEEIEVPADSPVRGQPLARVKGSEGNRALVVSIRTPAGQYELNPPPERPLAQGDVLVVLGSVPQIVALKRQVLGSV